jgi:hypothetical protein
LTLNKRIASVTSRSFVGAAAAIDLSQVIAYLEQVITL